MIVVNAKNVHAVTHDVCRRATTPTERSEDGVNLRMRYPLTYVVDRPLQSAPLWGGTDPFFAFKGRLAWAGSQVLFADGLLEGAKAMKTDAIQMALAVGDVGRVHFQQNEGVLESFVVEPFIDGVDFDFGRTTFLMELLAAVSGMGVGRMWLTSPAFCVRNCNAEYAEKVARSALQDPYDHFSHRLIGGDVDTLMSELPVLIEEGPVMGITHPYLRRVAAPIYAAHAHALEKRWPLARRALERCESDDWNNACASWINKMEKTR